MIINITNDGNIKSKVENILQLIENILRKNILGSAKEREVITLINAVRKHLKKLFYETNREYVDRINEKLENYEIEITKRCGAWTVPEENRRFSKSYESSTSSNSKLVVKTTADTNDFPNFEELSTPVTKTTFSKDQLQDNLYKHYRITLYSETERKFVFNANLWALYHILKYNFHGTNIAGYVVARMLTNTSRCFKFDEYVTFVVENNKKKPYMLMLIEPVEKFKESIAVQCCYTDLIFEDVPEHIDLIATRDVLLPLVASATGSKMYGRIACDKLASHDLNDFSLSSKNVKVFLETGMYFMKFKYPMVMESKCLSLNITKAFEEILNAVNNYNTMYYDEMLAAHQFIKEVKFVENTVLPEPVVNVQPPKPVPETQKKTPAAPVSTAVKIGKKDLLVGTSNSSCYISGHKTENRRISVPIFNKNDVVEYKETNSTYCPRCRHYYLPEYSLSSLSWSGIICCRRTSLSDLQKIAGKGGFDNLEQQSEYNLYGYNVGKKDDLSTATRQRVLKMMIRTGIKSKSDVRNFLTWLINSRKNMKNMQDAIAKWSADFEYVKKL